MSAKEPRRKSIPAAAPSLCAPARPVNRLRCLPVTTRAGSVLHWLAEQRPAEARRAHAALVDRVRETLAPRLSLIEPIQQDIQDFLPAADRLDDALIAARNRLDLGPIRPEMTVHAAHARHPGVRAIFARHGLPACPDCAVGRDETLAEAASGEGFALSELIAELQGLEKACAP